MTRIASYFGDVQTCGRNDGGPLYLTQMCRILFGNANVAHIFPQGDFKDKFGKFDLNMLVDWGEDALGFDKFELPSPSVYVASDTHLGYDYRLSRAKRCDYVFCNQKKAVDDFMRDGIPKDRVFWLPHAYDPMAYSPGVFNVKENLWDPLAVPLKRYDVCFIGNLNDENRVNHLDRLFKEFPNFYWGTQRFHEAAEKYNQSRIVFNVSSRKELNMRHFEALGAGAFLLSDNIPEDQNVFVEGSHFVGYGDMDEMVEKAKYYLGHEAERREIAARGHMEAARANTYMHRMCSILDKVGINYDKKKAEEYLPREIENACA